MGCDDATQINKVNLAQYTTIKRVLKQVCPNSFCHTLRKTPCCQVVNRHEMVMAPGQSAGSPHPPRLKPTRVSWRPLTLPITKGVGSTARVHVGSQTISSARVALAFRGLRRQLCNLRLHSLADIQAKRHCQRMKRASSALAKGDNV